uniref:RAVE complex protein Rav1 C-terminal domain-containing protein n=1 Tax=Aureoumbra lagunensis TaxID=44058 RepID=A0A7S3JQY9_9STRA
MKDKVWKGSSSTSYPEPEMNGPAAKMVTWQYDGIELAAWPSPHGGVVIVDTETPRLIDWVRDVRSVTSLQPACCRLACGMNDGRVVCLTVWRDSLRMQWRVETASNERGPRVERVSSSSDGNRFVTQRYGEETVRLYYCSSRTRLSCFALIKNPNIISLHLSATGMWFALATSREIRCWNATVLWSQDIIASSKVKDEQQEQKLETILFTSGIIPEHKPRRMVRWRGLRGTELLLTTSIDTALVFAAALINGETVLSLVWCLDIMGIELITWVQCGLHLNSSAELARSDTDNTPQERKRRPSKGSSGNLIHHHTDDETPRTDFHQHHARRPQAHFAGIAWIALVTRQDAKIETRLIALGPLAETQQPYEAIVRFEKFTQSSVISASALFAGEQPLSSALRSARFTLASSQFDASTAIWCPNSTRYLSHATWLDSNPTLLANAGPVQLIRLSDDQTSLVSSWAASDELPLPVISLQLNVCAACWDHQHSFVVITRDGALSIISLHGSLRARSSPRVLGNTLGLAKEMHLTALDGLAIFTMKKDETLLELSAYRYEIEDKKVKVTYLTTASERSACIYGGNSLSTVTATTSTDGTILALWNLLPDSKMFLRREFVRSDMRRTSSGASASSSSSSRRSMSNNQYTFRASTLTTTRERIAIVDHRAAIDFWRRVAVGPEDWQIETRLAPPADATADVVVASFCGRGLLAVVDAASHVRLFATTKQYGWRIVAVVDRPIPVAARCFLLDSHLPLFLRQDDANKSLMHMKNDEKNETSNLFASIVENNEEKDSAGLLEHLYKIAKKNAIGRLPIMGALCAKLVPNERFVDEDAFKAVGSNADTFLMNLSNDESSNNFSAPFREALAKHRLSWWAPVSKLRTVFVEAANALVRGRRRRLSGPPASILVALPYIVAGRVSTLASLAKADAVTDTAAGRFYKLLTAFDFSSDRGRLAATKNAFSLLAKHDDITAAAVFCLAKPPLILDAAQVAMDRLEDPDLALAIARLADDDESTNSTIRNPDHAELTIGRRHTHATKENGHKLKTTSSYYTRLVLKKLLLPKFRRQKDHAMEALALIWLDRPTAAARALDRLGKQLSTIHPSLPMPNFDTTFAALAVPTLLFALDVLRRATSADSRRRRRLAAIRAANAALCHGASETALSFLTCADIEIPLLPENKTAFDVHSSSALDDFDPAPQQRSALDSFDPAPQQRSALDSFDPAPQQRSA